MPSMPTIAGLKKSAGNATHSVSRTIDRQKSMPMKQTNWNPYDPNAPRPQDWVPPVKPKPNLRPPPVRQDSAASANSDASGSSSIRGPPPPVPTRSPAPPPPKPRREKTTAAFPPRPSALSKLPPPPPSSAKVPPAPPSRSPKPPPMPARSPIPPPTPARSFSSTSAVSASSKWAPPPVLPRRTTSTRSVVETEESEEFHWSTMSPLDKEIFFGWLDDFFGMKKSSTSSRMTGNFAGLHNGSILHGHHDHQRPPTPPPVHDPLTSDFVMSYPPPATHGSAACDFAHFMAPSTHWDSEWYLMEKPIPPPLGDNPDVRYTYGYQSHRRGHTHTKTVSGAALFDDLSMCWYSVQLTTEGEGQPDPRTAVRTAEFLPRPKPLGRAALVAAHETYGEGLASYAESFVGSGQVCARGECWDLANEGLKRFEEQEKAGVPRPVPSVARTHGHLVFEGKANAHGHQAGRWRGGDDRVRRGDIVEWRKARVNVVDAQPGSWMQLGLPDHTGIIVRDAQPGTGAPSDGDAVLPSALGVLEVVEQMHGVAPRKMVYDLDTFESGEMWIYRPVGMKEYIGSELEMTYPANVHALAL